MKICILIPAYNEAKNIVRLVQEIRNRGLYALVVDDGSADATASLAAEAGAEVLLNSSNQGKGFSLQRGFNHVASQGIYAALITMDGDGQHSPEDLSAFVTLFEKGGIDIICGNRMNDPRGMPALRLATNRFMSWLISLVCRQRVEDSQCGFRLIRTDVLKDIQLASTAFEIESEVLIKASKKGYRIGSVDIRTIYAGEKSRINPFSDTWRFIVYIVRELLSR